MALSRRQFIAAMAASSIGAPKILAAMRPPVPPPTACTWSDGLKPKSIIFVGDVQRTSTAELAFIGGRTQNDTERELVLKAIGSDKPDLLVMLGDQVVSGDDDEQWSYFDKIMTPINSQQIPVHSLLGNHDYGDNLSRCMRNYEGRFPHQGSRHHAMIKLGEIALVTVNSNFSELRPTEIREQEEDYRKWIEELDNDPTVRGVIVASHHPPYSNSDLGGSPEVIESFARPFLKARKTRLYLSGHVHSYERFVTGEKQFIVSGGGGGPRREIITGPSRPYHNDAFRVGAMRPFHYVRMKVEDSALKGEIMMLQRGRFVVGDRFSIGLYS